MAWKPSDAWGDLPDIHENYIQAYCSFFQTPTAASYISHFAHELIINQAQRCLEDYQKSDS